MSVYICVYIYTYIWTALTFSTHACVTPNFLGRNTLKAVFQMIIFSSVLGLKYFYYTETKNFTSLGFYQMYSRGFIHFTFYDTCSNIFLLFLLVWIFWLFILLLLKQEKHAFDSISDCLFLKLMSNKSLDFIAIYHPHKEAPLYIICITGRIVLYFMA